jgi:long-chain acyl-CoA synthetase
MNAAVSFPTIVQHLDAAVETGGARTAFRFRANRMGDDDRPPNQWLTLSWAEYGDRVQQLAAAFVSWGVLPGDRVAILADNCWQWHVSDMAALTVGAVSVPIYPTSSPPQISYILQHSGAATCIVGNAAQQAKTFAAADELSSVRVTLQRVVRIHPDPDGESAIEPDTGSVSALSWDQACAAGGHKTSDRTSILLDRFQQVNASDLATIVYTSGTTGPPKGVMLTHRNIVSTVDLVRNVIPLGPTDRFLSFLPLSHIAERVVSNFGHIASGGETWFAKSFTTVSKDIVDCKPTVFFAVPRVWEKVREAFEVKAHELDPIRKHLIQEYQRCESDQVPIRTNEKAAQPHHPWSDFRRLESFVLDRTIGRSIRTQIGLSEARALFSGAAPIDPDLLRWLRTIGLVVGEVYGQTEVCGPTSLAAPDAIRIGTVGHPLPGIEVRIDPQGSEILVRGPSVCAGYFHNIDDTRQLFDSDGWMRSGDLGAIDDDGYLRITGRKKDLMKTASGKYVAPQELELRLRSCRFIANAVVVAEGRPFISALLTLDAESVGPWAQHRGKPQSIEALALDPELLNEIKQQVDEVNMRMSPPERVRRWRVLPRDFTVNDEELTPTLKVVRSTAMAHFAQDIALMYPTKGNNADSLAERTR